MGKLDNHMQKMKSNYYLTPYTKIKSKWIKDLNIRPQTIELTEENTDGRLLDISLGGGLFGSDSKSKGKWYCIKPKSFCTAKEITTK